MTPPTPHHPVLDAAARFRARLLAREQEATARLTDAYGRAYQRLQTQIDALQQAVAALKEPDEASVRQLAILQSLQAQVVEVLDDFSRVADGEIRRGTTRAIGAGIQDSAALVRAYGDAALIGRFDNLAVEQAELALGFVADDSPLHQALVNRLGPTVARRMGDALVEGILIGQNPREIARMARKEFAVGLDWALTTVRTAQLTAYREASRQNYLANRDVVGGYIWYATLDGRVCASCLNQHGREFGLDVAMSTHHNCRCTILPVLPLASRLGIGLPPIESGESWFRRQSETRQQEILGKGMWDAWRAGAVQFGQMSHPYSDPVYGSMQRVPTMQEVLGGQAQRWYRR